MRIRNNRERLARAGFTLVELLVVLGLMMLLMVPVGLLLRGGGGETVDLRNAQRNAISYFQAARMFAIARSTEVRVLIYNDDEDPSKEGLRLRYLGMIYWDDTTEEEPPQWRPVNAGKKLPAGIFYVPEGTTMTEANGTRELIASRTSGTPDAEQADPGAGDYGGQTRGDWQMSIRYPSSGSPSEDYFYYAYDGTGKSKNAGSIVIFAAGKPKPPSSDPGGGGGGAGDAQSFIEENFQIGNAFAVTGFYLRRAGNAYAVDDAIDLLEAENED